MKVLIECKPSVIHLTGDNEFEAVANYMWDKHHVNIYDMEYPRGFAIAFMIKWKAEAKLHKYKDKVFYYPVFK